MDSCSEFQQKVVLHAKEGLAKLELLWAELGYDEADVESRKEKS